MYVYYGKSAPTGYTYNSFCLFVELASPARLYDQSYNRLWMIPMKNPHMNAIPRMIMIIMKGSQVTTIVTGGMIMMKITMMIKWRPRLR